MHNRQDIKQWTTEQYDKSQPILILTKQKLCTQLIETFNDWKQALEEGQSILAVLFDVEKAFEGVLHAKLIDELPTLQIVKTNTILDRIIPKKPNPKS